MIPFVDLNTQYKSIRSEIEAAVLSTLASGQFVLGKEVAAFEEEFAAYQGAKFAVGVNSGTSALHLALLAAGVGPGDEVITVSCTFVATVAAIDYTGARPVYVDVDPITLNMDPAKIEAAITDKTKAILPVHLHGQPADMDPILEIARRHKLRVIEDAAQAHGAEYKGHRVGSIGDLGCFSFYPGKNLGAYGEGGMVVTNDNALAERIRSQRDWGQEQKYHHVHKGFNYRMEGVQGAMLRVKLRYLDDWTEARRRNAQYYDERLADVGVQTPTAMPDVRHVYHVYAIRFAGRDALQQALQAREIQTGIHYPIPVHLQPAYAEFRDGQADLPVTEAVANELLSLPMFPELQADQIDIVCAAVSEILDEL
jgi:dTDP-4-amino-4,6-dideoxygalactose transaminase